MKKELTIFITENDTTTTDTASSVSNMWKKVKEIFVEHPAARLVVKDADDNMFKDLHLEQKANGKNWMVNDFKETNRVKTKKVKTKTEPTPEEIEEDEAGWAEEPAAIEETAKDDSVFEESKDPESTAI